MQSGEKDEHWIFNLSSSSSYEDKKDLLTFEVEKETMALCWQYIKKKNKKDYYDVLEPRVVQLMDLRSGNSGSNLCSHSFNKI